MSPYSSIFNFGTNATPGGFFGFNPEQFNDPSALGSSFLPAGNSGESPGLFGQIGGLEGLGQIAKGLASLGSIYSAFQGLNLAKDQFKFSKNAYKENLANSKKAYNTSLADRIRSRYATEGRPSGEVQSYLDKYSL